MGKHRKHRTLWMTLVMASLVATLSFSSAGASQEVDGCSEIRPYSDYHSARTDFRGRMSDHEESLIRLDRRSFVQGNDTTESFIADDAVFDHDVLDAVRDVNGPVVFVAADASLSTVRDRTTRELSPTMAEAVTFVQSCISSEQIAKAESAAAALKLEGSDAVAFGYAWQVDRIVVTSTLSEATVRSAFDLPANVITVAAVEPDAVMARASRTSDSAPHKGGAEIQNGSGETCSSYFTLVKSSNGVRKSATAGHCAGSSWTSGSHTFSTSSWRPNFPARDMRRLGGSTYTDNAYSADNNTSHKDLKSSGNPGNGYAYCNLGSQQRRACFLQDQSGQQFCDAAGCTTNLSIATELYDIIDLGDSGGPVAKELSVGLAARGMVVAQSEGVVWGTFVSTIYYHVVSDVNATLNVYHDS